MLEIIKFIVKICCLFLLFFGFPGVMAWVTHTEGAGFIFFLFIILIITQIRSLIHGKNNSRWPITEGLITDSRKVLEDIQTERYSVRVHYKYSVRGKEYENNTLSLDQTTECYSHAAAIVFLEKYPKGKTVEVYYNPKKPGMSVLETGLGDGWPWAILAFYILILLGTGAWMGVSKLIIKSQIP